MITPMTYDSLREKLDDMGYYQPLLPDSVPLVESLLNDILKSNKKDSSMKYPSIRSDTSVPHSNIQTNTIQDFDKKDEFNSKLTDLKCLNEQFMVTIKKLQEELLKKSKKITELESDKACIVSVDSKNRLKPKMEVKYFCKPSSTPKRNKKLTFSTEEDVSVIQIYEKKNFNLTKQLEEALRINSDLKNQLQLKSTTTHYGTREEVDAIKNSDFVSKLIQENDLLNSDHYNKTKYCLKSESDDLIEEEKVFELQTKPPSFCTKKINFEKDYCVHKENKELKKRITYLEASKNNLKEKLSLLKKQRLIQNQPKNLAKIQEILSYMDKQKNIYKANVEHLIKNFDNKNLMDILEEEIKSRDGLNNEDYSTDHTELFKKKDEQSAKYLLEIAEEDIKNLNKKLKIKEGHLISLANENDKIVQELDEKTAQIVRLKADQSSFVGNINSLANEKSHNDKLVTEALSEYSRLQADYKSLNDELSALKNSLKSEKSAGEQLRIRNDILQRDLKKEITKNTELKDQFLELKTSATNYIQEVKRVENLLYCCEQERTELLKQYKQLSDELYEAKQQKEDEFSDYDPIAIQKFLEGRSRSESNV